jgi:ABC-type uncharacterized transport system permease subunit
MKGIGLLSIIGCITLALSCMVVNIDLATDLFISGVLLSYFALALFISSLLIKNKNK